MSINQRAFFRLRYPVALRPTLHVGDKSYPISEISEGGMRIYSWEFQEFTEGDEVLGHVTFEDGTTVELMGLFMRRDHHEYVFAPLCGITMKRVLQEQRAILRRYPIA